MDDFHIIRIQGSIDEDTFLKEMSLELNLEIWNLATVQVTSDLLAFISAEDALQHQVFPVRASDDELWVAMNDPLNKQLLRNLSEKAGKAIRPVLVRDGELRRFISWYYGKSGG
ncbi:MAG: hypothetical protein K1X53_11480 [Candidatus Sumerlaeaceae bacterium]|nr:hypothetical protein [Candidatus Sumerlaeaceae bacterium]